MSHLTKIEKNKQKNVFWSVKFRNFFKSIAYCLPCPGLLFTSWHWLCNFIWTLWFLALRSDKGQSWENHLICVFNLNWQKSSHFAGEDEGKMGSPCSPMELNDNDDGATGPGADSQAAHRWVLQSGLFHKCRIYVQAFFCIVIN